MYKIKLILFFLFIGICCNANSKYKSLLEKEYKKYFSNKDDREFISSDEIKQLLLLDNDKEFMEKALITVKDKYFPLKLDSTTKENDFSHDYGYSELRVRIEKFRNKDINLYLEIMTEINKKANIEYINGLIIGGYKLFYKVINSNFNNIDKEKLILFINSLPNEKLCILSEYWLLKISEEKINYKSIYNIYKKINKDKYKKLLKESTDFNTIGFNDIYIDELSYYYDLIEIKNTFKKNEK